MAGLAAVVSAPALAAGYWLADGLDGPVTAAGAPILPAFVAASSTGPDRARTLVLRQDGGTLSYSVLRAADPVPGEPELAETAASRNAMEGVVASLSAAGSGDAGDTGRALSQFDIGYVLMAAPADQALANQLNTAAGLQSLTRSSSYDLWQVSGTVARARVVTPSGAAVAVPSGPVGVNTMLAPGTSGTLVLAEATGGWSATLDGRPLTTLAAPVDGWAQGFTLPRGRRPPGDRAQRDGQEPQPRRRGRRPVRRLRARPARLQVLGPGARRRAAPKPGPSPPSAAAVPAPEVPGGPCRGAQETARKARRKRRPQLALAGVTAGRGARAEDGDDTEAGYPVAAGAADDDPFGTHDDPGYGAASTGPARHRGPHARARAGRRGAPGRGSRALGRARPAADPADPGAQGPARPRDPAPAPAAPRRGRGAHAARHGKPSRRSRGEG